MRTWPEAFPKIVPPGDDEFEFGAEFHRDHVKIFCDNPSLHRSVSRDDWLAMGDSCIQYTSPEYMLERKRISARQTERRVLVRELMLRHPELTGAQAIAQADEILSTLEGLM